MVEWNDNDKVILNEKRYTILDMKTISESSG